MSIAKHPTYAGFMTARPRPFSRAFLRRLAPLLLLPLGACNWVVMSPAGDVAVQQRDNACETWIAAGATAARHHGPQQHHALSCIA